VTNQRDARRARHGASHGDSATLRWSAAALAGLLGFAMVFSTVFVYKLQHTYTTQDIGSLLGTSQATSDPTVAPSSTSPTDAAAGKDVNILLIGSDTRDGVNGDIGGKVAPGMRSDTTIIMHISADRSRVDFLSIPRDTRVRFSDCKMFDGSVKQGWTAKFNTAFSRGGENGNVGEAVACTMRTVTDLTGITFDHYAVIDFAGFRKMIDAVDGVPMCIPERIDSDKAKLHLNPGAQVLDGGHALAFARARYGIGDGSDPQRIERQQELMTNLMKKVLGMNLLTDAQQLTLLLKSAGQSMTMDPDLGSFSYLLGLGYSLRSINQEDINFMTTPWEYPGDKSGDVVWTPEADDVFKRITQDLPMEGAETEAVDPTPDPTGTDSGSSTPTPTATDTGKSTPEPTASATPKRLTEKEILAACDLNS